MVCGLGLATGRLRLKSNAKIKRNVGAGVTSKASAPKSNLKTTIADKPLRSIRLIEFLSIRIHGRDSGQRFPLCSTAFLDRGPNFDKKGELSDVYWSFVALGGARVCCDASGGFAKIKKIKKNCLGHTGGGVVASL